MSDVNTTLVSVSKKVKDSKEFTAQDAGITSILAGTLEDEGYLTRVGTRPTGKRGRPPFTFKLTRKAKDRVKRASGQGRKAQGRKATAAPAPAESAPVAA